MHDRPPFDAPYWDRLTPRQKVNDLVHKISQRGNMGYTEAYMTARRLIDGDGPGTYADRLTAAGLLDTAIAKLIEWHNNHGTQETKPAMGLTPESNAPSSLFSKNLDR